MKSAPRSDGAASPDLSGIDERIAKIEMMRAQGTEIAQQGSKLADTKADAKPADDMPLRRLVAAALLGAGPDRRTLSGCARATKPLAPNPDVLTARSVAEKGVPSAGRRGTELLALVPKLLPAAQQNNATTTGTGIVERRDGLPSWSRSNAPIPPAPIAAPWWRGSLRLRCEMTPTGAAQ